jgi:hypothetical protein
MMPRFTMPEEWRETYDPIEDSSDTMSSAVMYYTNETQFY